MTPTQHCTAFRLTDVVLSDNTDPVLHPSILSVHCLRNWRMRILNHVHFNVLSLILAPSPFYVAGYWIVRVPFPSLLIRQPLPSAILSSSVLFVLDFRFDNGTYQALTLTTQPATPSKRPTKRLTKMRRYYITSGILLILAIIDFTVAAPVLVQEKRQVDVNVVQLPEDVTTMLGSLGKRGDEFLKFINIPEDRFANLEDFAANPQGWGPSATRPPSGPADGSASVKQPSSTPEEPSTVPRPDQAPPSSGSLIESGDKLDTLPGPSGPAKSTMSRL